MTMAEFVLVGLAVGGAVTYLARRAWGKWRGTGNCCGGCPALRPEIRLAAGKDRDSIGVR